MDSNINQTNNANTTKPGENRYSRHEKKKKEEKKSTAHHNKHQQQNHTLKLNSDIAENNMV